MVVPGTVSSITMYDENAQQHVIVDERDFYAVKAFQLQKIKERAGQLILEAVPVYKQNNAALGLLSDVEVSVIKTTIQNIRNESQMMENRVMEVVWDGEESTRGVACDAIQNIWWGN